MTPLAHKIVKELTLPIKRRSFNDRCGLLGRMDDVHCFDASAVLDAAEDLALSMIKSGRGVPGKLAFLPAEKTWIEWEQGGGRAGVLLERRNDLAASVHFSFDVNHPQTGSRIFTSQGERNFLFLGCFVDGKPAPGFSQEYDHRSEEHYGLSADFMSKFSDYLIYAFLALINTPRVVGRTTHAPHRGLEKSLLRQQKTIGKYPLNAWSEIKLSITPPDVTTGEVEEAHFTGRKALHFCRAHLRIKRGKLELVSAHWRGDPALGIKQSRYSVAA